MPIQDDDLTSDLPDLDPEGVDLGVFESAFEHAPDAQLLVGADGFVVKANRTAELMFGSARAQLAKVELEALVPDHLLGNPGRDLAVLSLASGAETLFAKRMDGTTIPVSIRISLLQDVPAALRLVVLRDLTGWGRARETFRSLLESSPDAMVIVDAAGEIVLVNSQIEASFGYARAELLGQPVELLMPSRFQSRHPTHRTAYVSWPRVRRMGEELELRGRRRDGSEFPIEVSLSPVETAEGIYISSAIRDITQRRHDAQVIEEAAAERERVNRNLDELMWATSHDLQEPIRKMSVLCSRLRDHLGDGLDPTARNYLDRVILASGRARTLLRDILRLTNVTGPGEPLLPVEVAMVVEHAVELLRPRLDEVGARVELARDMPEVLADSTTLQQVFFNLIGNAVDFRRPGVPSVVTITAARVGDRAVIEVTDNGTGFDPAHREKIFRAFERLGHTSEGRGTGIGLAMSRRIIERSGGRIHATGRPGQGATLTLSLRLAAPPPPRAIG